MSLPNLFYFLRDFDFNTSRIYLNFLASNSHNLVLTANLNPSTLNIVSNAGGLLGIMQRCGVGAYSHFFLMHKPIKFILAQKTVVFDTVLHNAQVRRNGGEASYLFFEQISEQLLYNELVLRETRSRNVINGVFPAVGTTFFADEFENISNFNNFDNVLYFGVPIKLKFWSGSDVFTSTSSSVF